MTALAEDYFAPAANAKLGSSANPGKPLESIALAVQRVNTANVLITQFVDRFHGDSPAQGEPKAPEHDSLAKSPYNIDIGRLFEALNRLETRVEALNSIG